MKAADLELRPATLNETMGYRRRPDMIQLMRSAEHPARLAAM